MTISSQVRSAGPFTGTGLQTAYPFAFKVFQASDLLVARTDTSLVQSTLVLSSDYTVTLNADQNASPGGTVTLLSALPSGYSLTITSAVPLLQPLSLTNAGGFFPRNIEDELDRLTILQQQLGFNVGQALRVPDIAGVPPLPAAAVRAGLLLSFDASGNPIATAPASGSAASLVIDLASTALATKNAGQIGYNAALSYGAGTVGAAVKAAATSGFATIVVGDGVTDNSAAVLAANALGKPIFFSGVSVIGTATTITVPIVDTVSQIFSNASAVTINNGLHVRPEWFGLTTDCVRRAINSLPTTGGVVQLSMRRYPPNTYSFSGSDYMSKANVFIRGAKMPRYSANADRLEDGSIIEGRFFVFAANFGHENVGYDNGEFVRSTYYAAFDTLSNNHPNGGSWDGFAFAQPNQVTPLPNVKGFYARNCIGLCSRPLTSGHGMLMEGISEGFADNVGGVFGIHGCVIKSTDFRCGSLFGYMNSADGVIIKSDTYATCNQVQVAEADARRTAPNCTPWTTPPIPTYGVLLNPSGNNLGEITIGMVKAYGQDSGFAITGSGSFSAVDIQIGQVLCDGFGSTMNYGVNFNSSQFRRVQIGSVIINNAVNGIAPNQPTATLNDQLSIGSFHGTNLTGDALLINGFSRVSVDVVALFTCGVAYYIDDTARLTVGLETMNTVTTKWGRSAPALAGTWVNFNASTEEVFSVGFSGHRVVLSGLIKSGATASVGTVPAYLSPINNQRVPAAANNGSVTTTEMLIGAAGGTLQMNEAGSVAPASNYLSLQGVGWPIV